MDVEFIIPAFNEEQLLESNIKVLLEYLQKRKFHFNWKITIAVNGSIDRTQDIAQKLVEEHPGAIGIHVLKKGGKGNAIKYVALKSSADVLFYMDVDLAVSLEYIDDVIGPVLRDEADLVVASRLLPGSRTDRSFARSVSSVAYNLLSRLMLRHSLSDLQCGFKAGSKKFFHAVFPEVEDPSWFFDTELAVLGTRKGFCIKEVPVAWMQNRYEQRKSKVNFFVESFRFLWKLLKLRWRLGVDMTFMRRHAAVLLLALVIGAIYAGPDIYHAYTPDYQGVIMINAPDEGFYLSNVHRSYELTGLLGNPYLYEYRGIRNSFQYFLIELGLGKIGSAIHASIGALVIGMEFLFPALLALLLYAFAYALSRSRITAFFAAAAVLLGNELVHPNGIYNLFQTFLFHGQFAESLTYSRPVNPQASALLLWGVIISLLYLFRHPRSKKTIVLSGIALGGLLYVYIYFFAFAIALLGVMGIYAFVVRNWQIFFATIAAGIVGTIFSIPYMITSWSALIYGDGGITQAVPTHHPIVEKMILLPLFLYVLVYIWAWWSKGEGKFGTWAVAFAHTYIFILLLLLTGVIVSNQQVITGKLLQQQHFHFFTNIPLFLLAMSILGMEILACFPRIWRVAAVGSGILILVWFSVGVQVASYQASSAESARYQALMKIYTYLNETTPALSVVFADPAMSSQMVMYTHKYVYSDGGYDPAFQVPQDRILHDYFMQLVLRGVKAEDVRSYVYQKDHRNEIGGTLFIGTYLRDLCGSYSCFPDSVLENLITEYKKFLQKPLLTQLKMYKVDYVLWDSAVDPEWALGPIVTEPALVQSGDFKLYTVRVR